LYKINPSPGKVSTEGILRIIREDVNEVLVLLSGRDQIVVALAGCIFRTKIFGLKGVGLEEKRQEHGTKAKYFP
jgi:hypothetical protein